MNIYKKLPEGRLQKSKKHKLLPYDNQFLRENLSFAAVGLKNIIACSKRSCIKFDGFYITGYLRINQSACNIHNINSHNGFSSFNEYPVICGVGENSQGIPVFSRIETEFNCWYSASSTNNGVTLFVLACFKAIQVLHGVMKVTEYSANS